MRGVDAEAACDVRATTHIVRRLGDRIGCVHEPVAVCDLLVCVTTVARFDGVDGVPADGVNSDVAREVWRVEALPGEPLEWERERVRGSRIRYSYRLTDFVTNGALSVGRLLRGCTVGKRRPFGVPDHDDLAGAAVSRRDLRDAVDGVGEWLQVVLEGDVTVSIAIANRVVLELGRNDSIRDAVDPGGEVRALVEISPLAHVLAVEAMDQDDRVALVEGVVHTRVKATFVLGQPDVLRDTLAGIELAGDVDDVRGRRLRRRDRESHHEQEGCYEHRKYACAPSIHRSHSLSERVSLLAPIGANNILICNIVCVRIVLKLRHKYNELHGEQNKNDSTPSPICIFNLVDCYRDILYRAIRRT